jgi:tetratricopeptide (TPR) repeat protein
MSREYLIQHPICPCRGAAPPDPAMDHLLAAQPPQRVRDALAAHRLLERGLDAGPTPKAIALYTQGLALNPYPQDAYEMHIDIAVALIEQKRLDDAIAELQAAIGVLPGNRHAHEELGYVYELQHRMPQALAEFLVDAERGQSWAQMRSASFMLTPEPGVPLDRRTGARWMREAANSGEPLARDILRRHPELMIAFPQEY